MRIILLLVFMGIIYILMRKSSPSKDTSREVIELKDVVLSIMYSQSALIKILEEKGLITEAEVLEKIKEMKARGVKH